MMDRHYDELAHANTELIKTPTYRETHDLFYKFDKDEEQLFSSLRSTGIAGRAERDKKIFKLIDGMNDDDKRKYSFIPDPDSLKRILGNIHPNQHKKFYDFDKIAVDNGFLTNAQFNKIDQNNSIKIRKLIEKNRIEGGSALASFTGILASQINPLNAPENYVPVVGQVRIASILKKAARFALESAGIQTALEPKIHSWKDEINSPYEAKDSIDNILLSGVFGAGISGTISGIEYIIKSTKLGIIDKKILQDFVDETKENPFRDEPIEKSKEVKPVEAIPDKDSEVSVKPEPDNDSVIIKEVEDFQAKLNEEKDILPEPISTIEPISPKEKIDAIEKDFAEELKQSKELEGEQADLFVKDKKIDEDLGEISVDEFSDLGIEFKKNIDDFIIKRKEGIMIDERLIKEKSDKFNAIVAEKKYRVKEKGKWKSSKTIGDFVKENHKGEYILATKEHASFYKDGKIHDISYKPKDELYSSYYIKGSDRLKKPILETKDKKAGVSKGVDKKVSKIDDLSLAKDKKTAKIRELNTIVDDKIVPLKKVLDDTDIEIETYKGLKNCIL